jgi:hypothetical protein
VLGESVVQKTSRGNLRQEQSKACELFFCEEVRLMPSFKPLVRLIVVLERTSDLFELRNSLA